MTTPAPDISSLLDQLREQWLEVVKERDELREALRQVRAKFFEDYPDNPWIPGMKAAETIAIIDAALNNQKGPSE